MTSNPLTQKLSAFADLTQSDAAALDWLCTDVRSYKAKTDLIRQGARPEVVFLLVEGWAMRYKILRTGDRHIMAYLIPGDLCDPHVFILKEMDHSIGVLCESKVAAIPKEKILTITDERPALARALWWSTLVDESILREWLVNLGQRDARQRIAHLFVEMWVRLFAIGLTTGKTISLPLTQQDIGDTMGLTPVHVNRVLQDMRRDGLIELSSRELLIPDIDLLKREGGFDPAYLHLDRRMQQSIG